MLNKFTLPQGTCLFVSMGTTPVTDSTLTPMFDGQSFSLSLYAAKKMAFYFYTSPLFQKVRSRNEDKFNDLMLRVSNSPETDVGEWEKRIPMDENCARDDEKQPVLRYMLYEREGA